ncbi:MAG: TadE/TadG family type IV pilus assembly protein [Asticcacaulis sp.]
MIPALSNFCLSSGRRFLARLTARLPVLGVRGAAAVEFALIAAPLVFMICACIELGLVILVSVTLDNATDIASRGIRTGVTNGTNSSAGTFKQSICDNMGWLAASCPSSLTIDVQTYTSFANVPLTDPVTGGKLVTAGLGYNPGSGSQIEMVRAYYDWPLFTPFLQAGLATLSNGDALISSKAVFRNEPF